MARTKSWQGETPRRGTRDQGPEQTGLPRHRAAEFSRPLTHRTESSEAQGPVGAQRQPQHGSAPPRCARPSGPRPQHCPGIRASACPPNTAGPQQLETQRADHDWYSDANRTQRDTSSPHSSHLSLSHSTEPQCRSPSPCHTPAHCQGLDLGSPPKAPGLKAWSQSVDHQEVGEPSGGGA